MSKLLGRSFIGFREGKGAGQPSYAWNPVTGEQLQPGFVPATSEEVELAAELAAKAFQSYSRTTGRERGAFLRKIAEKMESIGGEIIERAGHPAIASDDLDERDPGSL